LDVVFCGPRSLQTLGGALFWNLLLAHFISDYPLQPKWMVRNKTKPLVLLVHVGIHFVVMAGLTGTSMVRLWPFLASLAGAHYLIDATKIAANKYLPDRLFSLYVADQAAHYITIGLTGLWISRVAGTPQPLLSIPLAVYLLGFVVVSYVWFISEQIIAFRNPVYQQEINETGWSRMLVRTVLLSLILILQHNISFSILPLGVFLPYLEGQYKRRALWSDIFVVCAVAVLVILNAH
jgi:hypothetical protein